MERSIPLSRLRLASAGEEKNKLDSLADNLKKWEGVTIEVSEMCSRGLGEAAAAKASKEVRIGLSC